MFTANGLGAEVVRDLLVLILLPALTYIKCADVHCIYKLNFAIRPIKRVFATCTHSASCIGNVGNSNYFKMYSVLFLFPILLNIFNSIPFFKSLLAVADDRSLNTFI